MGDHFFLSYSKSDGREFARTLADRLIATPPSIPVWLDERELQPGTDWDEQIVEALRTCAGLLFLMTARQRPPEVRMQTRVDAGLALQEADHPAAL